VSRIVIWIARGEMLVAHARTLVEKAAATTAHDRVEAGHRERAIRRRPDPVGVVVSAHEARSLDRRQPDRH
jgi:hypothetical protein